VEGLFQHDGAKVIQTSTAFTSGASGGGLFDDEGRLVGILTYRLRGANGYYFSTPVEWFSASVADRTAFGSVEPLTGPLPFWQGSQDALPYFLQASSLTSDHRWTDMLRLTEKWSDAEAASAEPWFARGKAYENLQRADAAIKSYRRAVLLDPLHTLAWFNLGRLYRMIGEVDSVRDVREKLRNLDGELFQQFLSEGLDNAKK